MRGFSRTPPKTMGQTLSRSNRIQQDIPTIFKPDQPLFSQKLIQGFTKNLQQGQVSATNLIQEKFLICLGQLVDPQIPTLAYTMTIQPRVNQKKRFIHIQGMSTQLLDYASSDYPTWIGLYCQQLDGYLTNNGQITHDIALAHGNLAGVVNKGGITCFNVLYQSRTPDQQWDITNIPSLSFKMNTSSNPSQLLVFPLQNQIWLRGRIIRVIV